MAERVSNIVKKELILWGITTLALFCGLTLSILSMLEICTTECAQGHNYRLLGFTFEEIGIPFFFVLTLLHTASIRFPIASPFAAFMIANGVGSEIYFIYIQKALIGHWCPVCLSIASCIGIAAVCYFAAYVSKVSSHHKSTHEGIIMSAFKKGWYGGAGFLLGLIVALLGVTKFDPLVAAENEIKDQIAFGDRNSPIEIYIFTDWQCPACRQIEPLMERLTPKLESKAQVVFVDYAIHPESLNFTPYNLSFMINNKDQYFKLRHALEELAERNSDPTEEEVMEVIKPIGAQYKQLNYSDIALGMKYFKRLGTQFGINGTPVVVVVNNTDKRGKKLKGAKEITETNIMQAISSLR